jgi:hypothetical protein
MRGGEGEIKNWPTYINFIVNSQDSSLIYVLTLYHPTVEDPWSLLNINCCVFVLSPLSFNPFISFKEDSIFKFFEIESA